MPTQTRVLSPGPGPRRFVDDNGVVFEVPAGWAMLPPGDPGLTRRVKAAGPTWLVEEKKGRKRFSRGLWAPAQHIADAKAALSVERADPAYAKKLAQAKARRDADQADYVVDFTAHVVAFLRFHERYAATAEVIARAVAAHATPVGSGTVARTERIPVAERAERAVIAWMRHQTTSYDDMVIPKVKGARREVRRELAERSRKLLGVYRRGDDVVVGCPIQRWVRAQLAKAEAARMPGPLQL
jgi:hypothetical protein